MGLDVFPMTVLVPKPVVFAQIGAVQFRIREKGIEAVYGITRWKQFEEAFGSQVEILLRVTQLLSPSGREKGCTFEEVEVEESAVSVVEKDEKAIFVLDAFLLDSLAFLDVDVEADNPVQFSVAVEFLDASALQPLIVTLLAAHAKFQIEGTGLVRFSANRLVGAAASESSG
jgi:hypothetical protein